MPAIPDWPSMLSNEWFSSISTKTWEILVYGATRLIEAWQPPDGRLIANVLVSAVNARFCPESAAWSWHSFQSVMSRKPALW